MHFKQLCRGAEKNSSLFLQNTSSSTNWHRTYTSIHCRIMDWLFHIPIHLRFPSPLFWLAGICESCRQISCGGLYQNVRCSVMWQIIPFYKGSIRIICRHMHARSERLFLVLIIDRMSERKMWYIILSLHPPDKSIIHLSAVIPGWKIQQMVLRQKHNKNSVLVMQHLHMFLIALYKQATQVQTKDIMRDNL